MPYSILIGPPDAALFDQYEPGAQVVFTVTGYLESGGPEGASIYVQEVTPNDVPSSVEDAALRSARELLVRQRVEPSPG